MKNTKEIAILGILTAIILMLAVTPLGFIPIGPIAATTMHMPVIIAAILYGKKTGTIMGLIFGLTSFARAYMQPSATSFVTMDPLVSVLPRICLGFLVGLFYEKVSKMDGKTLKKLAIGLGGILLAYCVYRAGAFMSQGDEKWISFSILSLLLLVMLFFIVKKKEERVFADYLTAILGTMFNTVSFLAALYFLHGAAYAELLGVSQSAALGAVLSIAMINGVVEAVASGIIIPAITGRVKKNLR